MLMTVHHREGSGGGARVAGQTGVSAACGKQGLPFLLSISLSYGGSTAYWNGNNIQTE